MARQQPATDEMARQPHLRGRALLDTPALNKDTAFTPEERRAYGLEGLLPPAVDTLDRQLERVLQHLDAKPNDLERYIYLIGLADRNETLFYRFRETRVQSLSAGIARLIATCVSFALCLPYLWIFPFTPVGMAALLGIGTVVMTLQISDQRMAGSDPQALSLLLPDPHPALSRRGLCLKSRFCTRFICFYYV